MRTVRDLHGRCMRVAVHRDHFHTETLRLDGDFLAELTRAQQ